VVAAGANEVDIRNVKMGRIRRFGEDFLPISKLIPPPGNVNVLTAF
jgi:hypothetical protein